MTPKLTGKAGRGMQFHGIGNEEHSAEAHHVTKCMHDHSHFKTEADMSKAAASMARSQSMEAQQQNQGQLSLSAWLDNYLSRGKSLLKGFWSGGSTAVPGEAGNQSGQEQVLAQIGESREAGTTAASGAGSGIPAAASPQADLSQAVHVSRAAQAAVPAAQSPSQEASRDGAGQESGGQEGMWRRIRVRFKDIAGQLTGHLRGNTSRFQAKKSFQPKQAVTREEPQKTVKPRRDAVEIANYHVEESYLLDSYDRKGGYSKISTKK